MRWSAADIETSIPAQFHRIAAEQPDRVAIAGRPRQLTYRQLDKLADRYAEAIRLRLEEPSRGRPVALLLEPGGALFAAALGALKCSMVVLTLNPDDPPARHAQLRAVSDAALLITSKTHIERGRADAAGFESGRVLDFQSVQRAAPVPPGTARGEASALPDADDLACLIATSGSTGTPKLVGQTHRNVLHNVLRYTNGLGIGADDRIALLASLAGGQGFVTTWTALLNQAALCPFPIARRGVSGLAPWLEDEAITVFDTLPSVLRSFAQVHRGNRIEGVRLVRLASEPATGQDFADFERMFNAGCALASVFACSEAGIMAHTTLHAGDTVATPRLPVGQPAEGLELLLLDDQRRPVADGDAGEVVVLSDFLSPGYWGDDALTMARFVNDGARRRFHTGDLARRGADGMLTIIGRRDNQVKVRGHRLQLEEVEAAITRLPTVELAAVTATTTTRGDTRLSAFVVPAGGVRLTPTSLRSALETELAAHAIPARFSVLESLPLGANGKIDRAALDTTPLDVEAGPEAAAAASETEELITNLWAAAFERDRVATTDRFLDLGGDSLIASVIAAEMNDLFGLDLDLRTFADNPSASDLGMRVHASIGGDGPASRPTPVPRRAPRTGPISYAQQRFWSQEQEPRRRAGAHVLVPVRITGPLDIELLRLSFERLVRRHEILRTSYSAYGSLALAVVRPPEPVLLRTLDLSTEADQQAVIRGAVAEQLAMPFDLARGPLLRLVLLHLGEQRYLLLRSSHHIIHDGPTWRILFEELAETYEALQRDPAAPELEPPRVQYLDYALQERQTRFASRPGFKRELEWWTEHLSPPLLPLPLPFARLPPLVSGPQHGRAAWGLSNECTQKLDRIAREVGATFFMSRLALASGFLMLAAGHPELLLRTPLSLRLGRGRQRLVGPLLNDAPIRLKLDPELGYADWKRTVRDTIIDVSSHLTSPWQLIEYELRQRGVQVPPADALYLLWNDIPPMRFGGLQMETLQRVLNQPPGLRFRADRRYEATRSWIEYSPRLHDPEGVERFAAGLRAFAAAVASAPEQPLQEVASAVTSS